MKFVFVIAHSFIDEVVVRIAADCSLIISVVNFNSIMEITYLLLIVWSCLLATVHPKRSVFSGKRRAFNFPDDEPNFGK